MEDAKSLPIIFLKLNKLNEIMPHGSNERYYREIKRAQTCLSHIFVTFISSTYIEIIIQIYAKLIIFCALISFLYLIKKNQKMIVNY